MGLPGYDETQEALVVFSEYLCGELPGSRLRLLATYRMTQRVSFTEICFIETDKKRRANKNKTSYFTKLNFMLFMKYLRSNRLI